MAPAAPPNHPPPRHSSWGQPGLRTSMGMPSCWCPAVLSSSPTHGRAPGGASMGLWGHSWGRVTFSPPTPATLGAWGRSRGDRAGCCPSPRVPGLGQAEVDLLGSITYRLAWWSRITLWRDGCHCRPLPQQPPATPLGPQFALTFSPRGPAGPGAPCGERTDLRGLAVPGDVHPGHDSPRSRGARSTAPQPLLQLTSLPDGPARPGAPASPWRRGGRGRCQEHLPTLCQGGCSRAGQGRHCPSVATATPAHLPSRPQGPACHGPPAEQSRGGFQGAFLPPHHTAPAPRTAPEPFRAWPIRDHWALTATPRHSHHGAAGTPGPADAAEWCGPAAVPSHLLAHLSQLARCPAVSLAQKEDGVRSSRTRGGQHRSWHSTQTPFLPNEGKARAFGPRTTHLPALLPWRSSRAL